MKWSELIHDINSSLKKTTSLIAEHSYNVDIVRHDCCPRGIPRYTVGIIFCTMLEGDKTCNQHLFRKEEINVDPNADGTHGSSKFDLERTYATK